MNGFIESRFRKALTAILQISILHALATFFLAIFCCGSGLIFVIDGRGPHTLVEKSAVFSLIALGFPLFWIEIFADFAFRHFAMTFLLLIMNSFVVGTSVYVVCAIFAVLRNRLVEKRLSLRFGLRPAFVVLTVAAVLLSIFVHRRGSFNEYEYYPDGTIMHRYGYYRDVWGTVFRAGKQASYYPSGARCYEFDCPPRNPQLGGTWWPQSDRLPPTLRTDDNGQYFLPDGTEVSQLVFIDHALHGKSAFHQRCIESEHPDLVWCQREGVWRKRLLSDVPGRIQI